MDRTTANPANSDATDHLENDVAVTVTSSNTSQWDGMPTVTREVSQTAPRGGEEKVVADHVDSTLRLYSMINPGSSVDTISYGPASSPSVLKNVLDVMKNSLPLSRNLALYAGFSYDKLTITTSLSNPKGIVGGLHVGYYPWTPWMQTNSLTTETVRQNANIMTRRRLCLAPECHLLTYGGAQDVKFDIPWTFPTPFLPSLAVLDKAAEDVGVYGTPLCFVVPIDSRNVTTYTLPGKLRMYVQFHGLKFYSPYPKALAQSGLEVAGAALAGMVVEKTISTGVEFVNNILSPPSKEGGSGSDGNASYTKPMAFQPAYVGDSTVIGDPPTTPVFHQFLERGTNHPIATFIERPQWIHDVVTSDANTFTLYANPTFPTHGFSPELQVPSYLRWFSQNAQYWRGTINFHFVIMGHPLIEVEHNIAIGYPNVGVASNNFDVSTYSVLKGVTSGIAHLVVPMPSFNPADHLQIADRLVPQMTTNDLISISSSTAVCKFSVVSTMMDLAPIVPIAVYISAGKDFEFYQPFAVGMNNVESVAEQEVRKLKSKIDQTSTLKVSKMLNRERGYAQVSLPEITTIFETRAVSSPGTSTLTPMDTIEAFMGLWSRALPYRSYDSHDEPYPEIQVAGSPVSWPLTGGSAAWTMNVNNSWFNTCDNVQKASSQFLLFRGSLGLKVIASDKSSESIDYMYIGLEPTSIGVRQKVNNPYTADPTVSLPVDANFGNGLVVTPLGKQPVLDLTLPFRSTLIWSPVCTQWFDDYYYSNLFTDTRNSVKNPVYSNVVLQDFEADLRDVLYRKAGPDFQLAIEGLLPPAPLWLAKGFDWS